MLKENRNIDHSYTDRVVRQLVDETEIDFNAGKVHLPTTDYSWTFDHFGPGGLENALRMTPSNSFGNHIINNYGIDEEEFEEVLTKYIEVIGEKINRYLAPIFNLQENKNIDWDYTDRVVKQLVDETEIDFKNSRVKLDSANFSFPFYSFGARRADAENLISEPNSNFGKHVISNYGVDETEYKEIYAMYMGIIASRLQDHDENVNHLYLHEHTEFDEKEYHYATQVVDRMVKESKIDDSHEDPSQWNIYAPHMGRWISPLGFISPNNRHWSAFENHMMEIYGLDWELVGTAWNNYLKEVTKIFRLLARKAMGDDTPPWDMQYDYLAESTEDNFLDTIVNQLVDETEIDYDNGIPHISAFPDPDFSMDISYYLNKDLSQNLFGEMFKSFWRHCRNVYGLTDPEIQKVWWEYKKEVLKKIEWKESLNESTEGNFLDKIVNQLVDETIIEDDEDGISVAYPSWIPQAHYMGEGVAVDILLDSDKNSVNFVEFRYYVNNMYGLDEDEIDYVWDQYRSRVWDKEQNRINDYQRSLEDDELNESLNSRVKKEVDDLWDKDKKLKDEDKIKKYFEDKGLNKQDADEAMVQYLSKQQSLNESVDLSYSDDKDFPFLNKLANHTMSITEIERNAVLFPFIEGYISDGNFYKYFHGTPYDQLPFEATIKMDGYLKDFGLTENEKEIWWDIYVIKVIDAINERDLKIIDSHGELNESTEDNILDRIAYSMYKESPPDKFPFDGTNITFNDYVRNMYGLSRREATYVYEKFRYLKGWHLARNPRLPESLNESTEDIYEKIANSIANESEIVISPAPYNKMFLKGAAWEQAQHIENVIDQLRGMERNSLPDLFVKHLKEIFNIEKKGYNTVVQTIWRLYRNKMIKKIEDAKERLNVPNKQQKFFDHILKTLVNETEVQTMKDWMPDDETYEQKVWVVPPFLNHKIDIPGYRDESVEWSEFSFFGYGYHRYMKDIYGLTDEELRKLWSPYYKALENKIDEVIERDRLIYGDD